MNKIIYTTTLFFLSGIIKIIAQQNLVPNPSFEIYSQCPNGLSTPGFDKLSYATGWSSYGDTPDYFNSCANVSSNVNAPDNFFGFQYANTGNAYCGIFAYMTGNFREYLGCQLISPLVIGQKYYVLFKVTRADKSIVTMACNKLGARFSTVPYSETLPIQTDNFAHIYSDSIITDTLNWITVSGSFVADSSYQYIIIGNFFDDLNTDTLSVGSSPYRAYYFIDDVYVSTDSSNSIKTMSDNNSISIFPNPIKDYFIVEFDGRLKSNSTLITVYNVLGERVEEERLPSSESKCIVNRNGMKSGIYILKIEVDEGVYYRQIIFQ